MPYGQLRQLYWQHKKNYLATLGYSARASQDIGIIAGMDLSTDDHPAVEIQGQI